ncbi:MAG: translation initiation factor IF-2 [Planctomycetota bacterium]|nr:MAG: translation initiation factor IF-2 [Planctomycetota bacterium]
MAARREEPPPPPKPPEPVKPAGPQVVPKPADLKGPRVVRIEAPEPVTQRAPRPRPAALQPREGPFPSTEGPIRPDTSGRGRGRRGGGGGESAPRSRSPRRHGNSTEFTERLREWRDQDVLERRERLASATGHGLRARRSAERRRKASAGAPTARAKTEVQITAPLTVKDFCTAVGVPYNVIGGKLLEHTGSLKRMTDMIDAETAELLAVDLDITIVLKRAKTELELLREEYEALERKNLKPRPPVVAMLGHVDHGKTSLLDAIRRTHVAAGEAGGITQHIGAYRIDQGDWHVTFLDTPGHEAFTSMRARGAHLTDVVVLVVAADDGVMPQTIEAINHAQAAGVQIVVALNKIDLPGVDLNKVYGQLAEHDLTPAEWGGSTDVIKTSAATGEGIDTLLEHLSTLSELLDLKADPTIPARGTVIEAQMREGRGIAAQVLVREGTLKPGQFITCGPGAGRVRSLLDDRGKRVKSATPGTPVEVYGLDDLPDTGDTLFVVKNLARAKQVAEEIKTERREKALQAVRKPASLEDLLRSTDESDVPELNVIVKADNQGSLEALIGKLGEFPDDKARLRVLHGGVGAITEADVSLAEASHALVIGFHVVAEDRARRTADQHGVEIRQYRVIYEVLDDVRKALEGLLTPEQSAQERGRVEVRQIFNVSRVGTIAGCYVTDGVVARNHRVRLTRDSRIVAENLAIESLKRFKDDVREVRAGMECGIKLAGYDDIKPGDMLEVFELVEVAQTL